MLDQLMSEKFILPLISTLFALYGGKSAPQLPQLDRIFENPTFRFVLLTAMVFNSTRDPQIALFVATAVFAISYALKKSF